MEGLLPSLLDHLQHADRAARTHGVREILGRVGEPEPQKAAEALLAAAEHPDLEATRTLWLPTLVLTARPGFAAQTLTELAARYRETRQRPLDLSRCPALPRILGSSDFLARLLLRHPHWTEALEGDPPAPPPDTPVEPDWTAIRITKYQGLLRIAARDLSGRPMETSLGELSDLADRCLCAGLARATQETQVEAATLFALGKLGGRELNFSSDVDLLFVYDAPEGPADATRLEGVSRLIQTFKRHLEAASEDGFAYRVDLDLRPEGRRGVIANSLEAALAYYESFGAEWERQVLLRLRYVGGPQRVADSFLRAIEPFVYRRLIDPAAIERVREMKQRIERERRSAGKDLEADLKEGPGGIRDVEFLVQALQLFYGGRRSEIRGGNVPMVLRALAEVELLPDSTAESLREAYLWLRRAEHCVQMVEERQTHRFPRDDAARRALARRMGYRDVDGARARELLSRDWARVRDSVREQFDALILEPSGEHVFRARAREALGQSPLLVRLDRGARTLLEKRTGDDVLQELQGPALLGLARSLSSQPDFARYLSHRPALLERLASASAETLARRELELAAQSYPPFAGDVEAALDWLRLVRRDETALAASLDLAGALSFERISQFLSILAETCVRWALHAAESEPRPAPEEGLAVIGVGKVAGRELTYHSDLDLIFLFPDEIGLVTGPSRTAQRVIFYLTTMTGAGVAYAVDSRLRPSGHQGALVSTFGAFARYQRDEAATWEHLALMRARVIAGNVSRGQELLDEVRSAVLTARVQDPWPAIADMRQRIERERAANVSGSLAFKTGAGGLMDVEFLASGGCLERHAHPCPNLPSVPAVLRELVSGPRLEEVLNAYHLLRLVEARARWLAERPVESVKLTGERGDLLAELVEPGLSGNELTRRLAEARDTIHSAYQAVVTTGTIDAIAARAGS